VISHKPYKLPYYFSRTIAVVAQPGTGNVLYLASRKLRKSLQGIASSVSLESLFPYGYPGSNPGHGVFTF